MMAPAGAVVAGAGRGVVEVVAQVGRHHHAASRRRPTARPSASATAVGRAPARRPAAPPAPGPAPPAGTAGGPRGCARARGPSSAATARPSSTSARPPSTSSGDVAQRGAPRPGRADPDADAADRHPVGGPGQHDPVDLAAPGGHRPVGRARRRPRVAVAGVRARSAPRAGRRRAASGGLAPRGAAHGVARGRAGVGGVEHARPPPARAPTSRAPRAPATSPALDRQPHRHPPAAPRARAGRRTGPASCQPQPRQRAVVGRAATSPSSYQSRSISSGAAPRAPRARPGRGRGRCRCRRSAARCARPDLPGPGQRRRRRVRDVDHLEVGVEGGEVQRHVGAQVLGDPRGQLVELGVAVVAAGDQQGRDLEPQVGLVAQVLERLEHRLEVPAADCAGRTPR